jgi:hypothetical protein
MMCLCFDQFQRFKAFPNAVLSTMKVGLNHLQPQLIDFVKNHCQRCFLHVVSFQLGNGGAGQVKRDRLIAVWHLCANFKTLNPCGVVPT